MNQEAFAELVGKLVGVSDELIVGVSTKEDGIIIEALDGNISADAMNIIVSVKERYGLSLAVDATDGLALRLW